MYISDLSLAQKIKTQVHVYSFTTSVRTSIQFHQTDHYITVLQNEKIKQT